MDNTDMLILIMALLLGVSLLFLWRFLRVNKLNPMGKGAEKQTARILSRYGRIRGFRVLTGVSLEAEGGPVLIEAMLIGYFGILLVHTCGARGEYAGGLDTEEWVVSVDGGKQKLAFPNPYLEQQRAAVALRAIFSQNKVYNVAIEQVVYMTSRSTKLEIYITNSGEILWPGKLAPYLGRSRFDKDAGLDVNQIAEIILAAQAKPSGPPR